MNPEETLKRGKVGLCVLAIGLLACCHAQAADPVVSNVRASQRPGTKLVDIYYDVADADGDRLTISVAVSDSGGATYAVPAASFTGDVGPNITPGNNQRITWDAGADWNNQFSANMRFQVTATDQEPPPSGMVLIPAGSFQMGDTFNEGYSHERPVHTVYVSAFYMDRYEVTKALWDEVSNWAVSQGYSFDYGAGGKANNHPAYCMTWYSAVKWCNARSAKENLTPVYCTSSSLATVYQTGSLNLANDSVRWTANGYRLPTEAEWEKAARGGASGHRFPWSDTDNITHSRANYESSTSDAYDTSPTRGYPSAFATGGYPYTSPVGYFAPNGYGLCDMAGNVWEWCWDWYGSSYYGASSASGPRGPSSGPSRVRRGGCWGYFARDCRTALRNSRSPRASTYLMGFRCVRPAVQ